MQDMQNMDIENVMYIMPDIFCGGIKLYIYYGSKKIFYKLINQSTNQPINQSTNQLSN